jgi:hypothetical protein
MADVLFATLVIAAAKLSLSSSDEATVVVKPEGQQAIY